MKSFYEYYQQARYDLFRQDLPLVMYCLLYLTLDHYHFSIKFAPLLGIAPIFITTLTRAALEYAYEKKWIE